MPDPFVTRILTARSMRETIAQLLDETPGVRDPARQQALTDRFLTPAASALEALFLELRREVDGLLDTGPAAAGRSYPLGRCFGITVAVRQRLDALDPADLTGAAAEGYAVLRAFREAGGQVRRAWGDLRGEYFQNALIAGALYVDVANDTVVSTKPKVEVLPFAKAGFRAVADYRHYACIARRYWRARCLPNHLLPELAPYLPLIQVAPDGRISLGASAPHMLGLTLSHGFAPSEQALAASPIAPPVFTALGAALQGGPFDVAAGPETGRAEALARCRRYRLEGRAHNAAAYTCAMAMAREANRRLANISVRCSG